MPIALRGLGASVLVDSGDFTPGLPSGTAEGDLLICCVNARDNVALTFPAGWTIEQQANNGTLMRSTVAWKIAAAGESDPTVTHTGGSTTIARIIGFSGCSPNAPVAVSGLQNATIGAATVVAPTKTPRQPDSMLVFSVHHNTGTVSGYTPTGTNPESWTEDSDDQGTITRNTALAIAHAFYGGTDPTGNLKATLSNSSINAGCVLVLAPQIGALGEGASESSTELAGGTSLGGSSSGASSSSAAAAGAALLAGLSLGESRARAAASASAILRGYSAGESRGSVVSRGATVLGASSRGESASSARASGLSVLAGWSRGESITSLVLAGKSLLAGWSVGASETWIASSAPIDLGVAGRPLSFVAAAGGFVFESLDLGSFLQLSDPEPYQVSENP